MRHKLMRHKKWIAVLAVLGIGTVSAVIAQDAVMSHPPVAEPAPAEAVVPEAENTAPAPAETTEAPATNAEPAVGASGTSDSWVASKELSIAVLRNDDSAVRRWIAEGGDVNQKEADGTYLIQQASEHASVAVMKLLIATQPDLMVVDAANRTAMHYAAKSGDVEKVRLLVTFKVPVDTPDAEGITPLYYAYLKGDLPSATLLLESGARINRNDNTGEPISFRVLAVGDREDVMKHMMDNKLAMFRPNLKGQRLQAVAESMGYEKVAKILKEKTDEMIKALEQQQQQQQGDKPAQGVAE